MNDGTTLAIGMVINADPEHGALIVAFRSGQIPALPVKMAYHGYADPLRVSQSPLPQKGTHGLVAFPNGDARNGIWLGAIYPNLEDAITSDPGDPSVDYSAHWSGTWSVLDASGNTAMQWPDGTCFVAGSGATLASGAAGFPNVLGISLPATYRHTVDGNGNQQRVEVGFSDRVADKPAPFPMGVVHSASGSLAGFDSSGNIWVSGAAGTTINVMTGSGQGQTTYQIDKFSNAVIYAGPGAHIQLHLLTDTGDTFIEQDSSGNIWLQPAAGQKIGIGTVQGSYTDSVPLVSLLLTWLNSHIHSNGNNGSPTGPPITAATAAEIESQLIKIES